MTIDIEKIKPIVREVQSIALPGFGKAEFTEKEEHACEIVTALDVKVEEHLRDKLAKIYPDIEFVGEETGGDRSANKKWICDPIDGTGLYVRGLPFCTTMLAYIENGRVDAGIIYNFVTDELYHAARGSGAFMNDEPIHVSDRPLKYAYLGWESQLRKAGHFKLKNQVHEMSATVQLCCAGHEMVLVASGVLDGRVCFDPYGNDYDFAPGTIIIEEAGGVVANIGKRDYDYTNLDFIAANPVVFKELTEGPDAKFPIQE